MNKTELVAQVANDTDLTQAQVSTAIDSMTNAIQNALTAGDAVALVGFGTFSVAERAARTGRNPSTGAEMKIAASKSVKFKVGKTLKDAVNVTPKKTKKK